MTISHHQPQYFIGLMSGTSMDGVDAVLVDFSDNKSHLIASHSIEIPEHLLIQLHRLCTPNTDEINIMGRMDRAMGLLFAQAVNELLAKTALDKTDIIAIGSHGQTIRHMPNLEHGFTLQIGDPETIAVETGINVIADFRRKDLALGGQGAPLVPAFHQAMFARNNYPRVILNIGGIANITYLPGDSDQVIGFDTGPGNTLMDAFILQEQLLPFDESGQWAASGTTDNDFLQHLLSHPYFAMAYPKSTGRELFNQAWLEQQKANFSHLSLADIQSTLLDLTCHSIANDINRLTDSGSVFVCGGGALNKTLMQRLNLLLPNLALSTTSAIGMDPKWVEGIAFAWLAMRNHHGLSGNLPVVTGASRFAVLGSFYQAN
ncbi:anhydro-N-acetylmuramic acid kinase [Shewanella sp. 1_MG-2023]|uniref:anhydro-N-acetylmuramic acid kinase n=1 Tax=unclassified Shewanella TaxID=196818 RepID=UPI000C833980|nr:MULTISPECIES: anhydro-N-acetylmuramic acid kinase [unclassified Shewanella]MCC4831240.1 anhydro-N-acetylmuramic acid kinase [Shewanella sp. 10N.7]MDO6609984.1 anhydro-N-acetylmuramic acid kinase [Shewanella sp. 7_MG-2023]MDO6769874.1 anhydro-N-acetylmuramic acid kinase [Shewanella sp. 2_MG-2023]MDO6792938.1 anhydro-N-acetylmuramic acid kinase [Shewanella sp. 1_MG-2023]PMG71578.1 anhydro-N-acetylmuramic acid kinase [Shewanella sp. 10N.286.51.B7]